MSEIFLKVFRHFLFFARYTNDANERGSARPLFSAKKVSIQRSKNQ